MFKANESQRKAIKTLDKNLLVNAGAGTGKTKVLVERYIELLENGNLRAGREIESIVAITFTKKAAEEMIDRIRENLRDKFPQGEKWRRMYRDIEKSNISTIHSFCSNILRENPIEANIDPMFEILDEHEADELLKDVIENILDESIENNSQVYDLFKYLKVNTIPSIVDDFYNIYNDMRNSLEDLSNIGEKINNNLGKYNILEEDLDFIEESIYDLKANMAKNAKIHRLSGDENWEKFIKREYINDGEIIDILIYLEEFLGSSKKYIEEINSIKETINKVSKAREMESLNHYMTIIDLIKKIDGEYNSIKREFSYLDYDDLQIETLRLLKDNKDVREYYQENYRYIMIDEFQDTNELQKEIFYILASKKDKLDRRNLFVVGDPKQSIYGFRGADLDVFYKVARDIENHEFGEIINLSDNYRTSSSIMTFLNHTFSNIMGDRYDALNPNILSSKDIEVEILEDTDLKIPEGESSVEYSRYYEADLIAKRIRQLVDEKEYDYGDIALLFRSRTRNYIYEDALRNYDIPFYNTAGSGFYDQQEILDLINGFKSIYNPLDDISNIGFLRSPMIGLSDRDIFWIMKEEGNIYEKMVNTLNNENPDIDEDLIRDTIELYDYLFKFSEENKYSDLFREIVSKTLYNQILLLNDSGKQSIANVDKYIGLIENYERDNLDNSEDILSYMDKISKRRESESIVESEDSNVVKILTIHKSKGLEFPVVILPELSSRGPGGYSKIEYDKDIGLGLNIEGNSGIYDEIREKEKLKDEEELERVLYVAMTRAENLLILGNQGYNSGFKGLISPYLDEKYCRFIDNINIHKNRKENIRNIDMDRYELEYEDIHLPNLIEIKDYEKEFINTSSISQYMTFKNCKREYFYKYRLKLSLELFDLIGEDNIDSSANIISAKEKGNIVHEFIENYRIGQDIDGLLNNIFKNKDIDDDKSMNQVKELIYSFIDNYSEDYDEIRREEEISLLINNVRFIGFIDMIRIKDNKVEIIDYKTNNINNINWLLNYYKPQLQFYAYALSKISDYRIISSSLMFLENGKSYEVDIDDDSMDMLLKELEYFSNYINKYDKLENYEKSKKCNPYCKYDIICNRKL